MTTPNYLACFPDFAAERLPPIPEWWRDVSYVNDTCPSWASGWLYLFIDYEAPERREIQTPHPRFSVRYQNLDTGVERDGVSSDDWGAVLRYMLLHAEVTDRASGENWLRGLMLIDCVFHLEDSPEDIISGRTRERLFTGEECAVVRERVAALYRLDWGDHECPIGFQLWLEGWDDAADGFRDGPEGVHIERRVPNALPIAAPFTPPSAPEDVDWGDESLYGYRAFWEGAPIPQVDAQAQHGWWMGYCRAYGMGVKAAMQRVSSEPIPPFAPFSGPAEAWAHGYDDERLLDGGA